ncbi:MAG: CoA transferase [Actinomycetota bacterium]
MTQPLSELRVVELSQGIAGPYAGKLLADYGADVIKVEPPAGDRSRALGPFPETGPNPDASATFLHLNTNKRSIIAGPDDALVEELCEWADIVLCGEETDGDALRARHPQLVVVSVTSFGRTGPYAGFHGEEIVHFALGGPMSATGDPDREPVKMGAALGQYQCGTIAALAALSALRVKEQRGSGVHVDLANVETQVGSIDRRMTYLLYGAYRNENVERSGGYSNGVLPNGCRPTADGHVQVSTLMNWIPRMIAVTENPDLAELYADPAEFLLSETVPDEADAHLLAWTLTRTKTDAMTEAQAKGWPVTAVNHPVDLLEDPHLTERGFFVDVDHPVAGPVTQPGAPIRMDDGWTLRHPAPRIGEHEQQIRSELAAAPTRPEAATAVAANGGDRLPLDGVRVLDLTVVWAGPYATCLLGDLGADIVRVDNPYIFPSATRGMLPRPPAEIVADIGGIFGGYPDADPGERPWNRVALFNAHARNKRSVTLDLRTDLGRETLLRLVEECDILIENNSIDLLSKLGLDWDTLHARNDQLIMIRMPSVGMEGPYRDYLGFGVNFEALCGLGAIRGYLDGDPSENESVFHMDAATGSAGAFAAMMALRRREATGVGELVELSQAENMLNHIGELLIDAGRTGTVHTAMGNRHATRAPQGCYPCTGTDAWAVISVGNDEEWAGLVAAMGAPAWADDERFATADGRRAHHDEIDEHLAAWTAGLTPMAVFHAAQEHGVPAAPVLHELDAFENPHLQQRGMFRPNGSSDTGTHLHPTHVWRWDGPDLRWDPLPVMGGHNEAVYRDLLGLSAEEYQALDEEGHLSLDYRGPDGTPL